LGVLGQKKIRLLSQKPRARHFYRAPAVRRHQAAHIFMRERSVLVTGGAGYIGSHACKALARAGYLPIVYDNLSYGHEWAVKWGPFQHGDILDRTRVDEVLAKYRPDAVMHFAAFAYIGESVMDPGKYYRNNVAGSLALLEAMRDFGIRKIVFSSTCATYGLPDRLPISEDAPQRPINPYGASKLMVERMLRDFERAHGLVWTALRYFNAAGADEHCEIGEDHDPETHLMPLVLAAASGRRPHVTIFGTDYDTPDGTCIRDYIHVTDLAEAHVLALQASERGTSTAYNLGNGRGFSVREVIESVERVTGLCVPAILGGRRAGDPPVLMSDASRAHQLLGWQAKITELDEMVRSAWEWHRDSSSRQAERSPS
jgi:UDP-arabinose 4-epimerase